MLRDAVAREGASVSLRQAAREIGTSPNGLRNFLNGAAPRRVTRAKLEKWLSLRVTPNRPPAVGHLVGLIQALAADLTPRQAIALTGDVAKAVVVAYRECGVAVPKWVLQLARRGEPARSIA